MCSISLHAVTCVSAALALAVAANASADDFLRGLIAFDRDGVEAVFSPRADKWDSAFRERGAIVRLDDGTLRLYYTGYDGTRDGLKQIGLAISTDNGRSWTRVRDTPVSPAGLWTEDPCVVRHAEKWHMFAEGTRDQAHRLESEDGLSWVSRGTLDIRLTSGEPIPAGPFGTPTAFVVDGVWNLLYERRDQGVWLARSTDLQKWTNVSDDPVIAPGPSQFDEAMIALNQVVHRDGRYFAYYHGADRLEKPRQWAVGVAVSEDLLSWEKSPANPVTDPAANVSSGMVVFTEGRNRTPTLFTTHGTVRFHTPEED